MLTLTRKATAATGRFVNLQYEIRHRAEFAIDLRGGKALATAKIEVDAAF